MNSKIVLVLQKNSSMCKNHVGLLNKWALRVFESRMWSRNQNIFLLSGKMIGAHKNMLNRTYARAVLNQSWDIRNVNKKCDFHDMLVVALSAVARSRAPLFMRTEICFFYPNYILSQKWMKIGATGNAFWSFFKMTLWEIFNEKLIFKANVTFWHRFIIFYLHHFLIQSSNQQGFPGSLVHVDVKQKSISSENVLFSLFWLIGARLKRKIWIQWSKT